MYKNEKLNPYFITGFALPLLSGIQSFFGGIGNISISKSDNSATYSVSSSKDLTNIIIPHFNEYPLLTQKKADFLLFKSVLELINKKEHLTLKGLQKIVSIRASMNWGITSTLKAGFYDITPFPRPKIEDQTIMDPHWLAGFTSAEGCLECETRKSKTHKIGYQILLRFRISQHSRDAELINSLIKYLNCGKVYSQQDLVKFVVTKYSEIINIIIPFFNKYPIQGVKSMYYADFCKIALLMKYQAHFTASGLDQIIKIKSEMNRGR